MRKYKGGFENIGKGTSRGDGKDEAMRLVADYCIVELVSQRPSSSLTTLRRLGEYDGEFGVTVMLARNGSLRGRPLLPSTKEELQQAHENGCIFVVGDMPNVDSQYINFLDEIEAEYTIYYCGNHCRIGGV